MKLFVKLGNGQKKYISSEARTKKQLAHIIGGEYFYLNNERFSVNEVLAETDSDRTAIGMAAGGALGVSGGPGGVVIGGVIGGIMGKHFGKQDLCKADDFNNSFFLDE